MDSGSILNDVKAVLGISEDDHAFDTDVKLHINTALMTLGQLGMPIGFTISGSEETWDRYFGNLDIPAAKDFIYLFVRRVFDPPSTSFALEAIGKTLDELAWRIMEQARWARDIMEGASV